MRTRNIVLLTFCQMISATGSIVLVTLGGIIGSQLTDHPALASLLAGTVLYLYGWTPLVLLPLPLLLAILVGLFAVRGKTRLQGLQAERSTA